MQGAMIVILYAMYVESIAGSDNFELMSGDDFLLMDGANFLLMGN